jgi:glycosyltransferase involved in cell wall biosynthesis
MPKDLSILVLTTSFPVKSSIAVGIHIIEKCRHLVKNGVKVKVLAPHHAGSKTKETIDGISVKRFRYFLPTSWQQVAYGAGIPTNLMNSRLARFQLPFFMLAFFLSAIINIRHIDIIHCHWSIAGLIGVIAGKLFNKKVVLMVHGAEVFVLGKNPVLKFVLKHVDCSISNSTFTEKKTHEVYLSKRSVVISPGVDVNRFYPQARIANLRHNLNIAADDTFVLAIGKFIPRKGFEYLIEAFNHIVHQRKITNVKLRIGGRGPLRSKYENMIDQYSLGDYIAFLEYIKDEDIPSYYSEADIFVLPSIVDERGDTEGLGVVFLEANACRTPVIGSKVGGISDVIKDGVNGFYVRQKNSLDLAEKIIRLSDAKELRNKMGDNGRNLVEEQFNWETLANKIIDVYDSLLYKKSLSI